MPPTSKEQKSRLRAVRLDRLGRELRGLDFIHFFLADRALHFVRKRNRARPRAGLGIREAPVQVVRRDGSEFRVIGRDQRDFHVGDGDRLVAVIGHDEKTGRKPCAAKSTEKILAFSGVS